MSTTTLLDPPLEGEGYDDDDADSVAADAVDPADGVEDAVDPEGAEDAHDDDVDPTAELKRLAEENAELRRQLAASTKGGDA